MPDYYRVKEAFAYGNAVASPGQLWSGDNPDLKGREHLFEPVEVAAARSTETATAGPGESRTRSKRLGHKAEPKSPSAVKPEAPGTPADKE
jgi:hypothetical protein